MSASRPTGQRRPVGIDGQDHGGAEAKEMHQVKVLCLLGWAASNCTEPVEWGSKGTDASRRL